MRVRARVAAPSPGGPRRSLTRALFPVALAALLSAISIAAPPGDAQQMGSMQGGQPMATATPMAIPELPTMTLQAVPGYGVAPLTVGFVVNAVDPANVGFATYQWNFGDGHVSTDPPLMASNTYQNPGTYIVTLIATTADGRTARASTGVIVRPAGME